jgi:NitT/TauT family transport system substrate-binding protein
MKRWTRTGSRLVLALAALAMVAAACSSTDDTTTTTAAAAAAPAPEEMTDVQVQMQWVTQAQFAGYYAALAQGYYEELGLNVELLEGSVDIVPAPVVASGGADFGVSWVPRALVPREQGLNVVNIAQPFQRSGTLQVSFKDAGITSVDDLAGTIVGNWGFGNELELLAGLTAAGLDKDADITLVQQNFDMLALLAGDIDAAQAMTYNEYAQVLETINPDTGELYQPDDLNVINWNDVGTAMLQDAILADGERLGDAAYRETAVKFVEASLKGWIWCRDNQEECVDIVLAAGPTLGRSHQTWQLNEINKLIWPSPDGIGILDPASWDQTVTVMLEGGQIAEAPSAGAFVLDIAQEALDNLKSQGLDVVGNDWEPTEVELLEGGN